MKKSFLLIIPVIVLFLIYSIQAFAAMPDKWARCQKNCDSSINKCGGAANGVCCSFKNQIDVDGTDYYCCAKDDGTWQTGACASCTDNDGDTYISESSAKTPDVAACGNVCGKNGNLPCSDNSNGKNDCDDRQNGADGIPGTYDDGKNINPGITKETCDGIDNDCDGLVDEGCDSDNDDFCDKNWVRIEPYSCSTTAQCCPLGGDDCDDRPDGADGISGNSDDGANIYPGKVEICDGIDNNCNNQIDEGCDDDKDKYCDANMRIVGAPLVCPNGGGDCNDNSKDISPGAVEVCSNLVDDNCNGNLVASLDNDPNTGADCFDLNCAGFQGPNKAICCQTQFDCNKGTSQDKCTIEACQADKTCKYTDRPPCDKVECPEGSLCSAGGSVGGSCRAPDENLNVCESCAGGKFGSNLFDSDGGLCLKESCDSKQNCACFDAAGSVTAHKPSLKTGLCCGDDSGEFYKADGSGGFECVSDAKDCVWSTGHAQKHDSGNEGWWCFNGAWDECTRKEHLGRKHGSVKCAGAGTGWTLNPDPENTYGPNACSDGYDNDVDGKSDCDDSDCAGTISGSVKDEDSSPVVSANIDVIENAVPVHTTSTNALGEYIINDPINVICGSFGIIASSSGYVASTQTIQLAPNENKQNVDFTLILGTACEADCTYAGDNLIHAECQGVNGCDLCNFNCNFCSPAIASQSCNLAQPGWVRTYDDQLQPECQATGCVIECGKNCPVAKIETKAEVVCEEKNLIKVTKLVTYKGKLAKLVIVTCG